MIDGGLRPLFRKNLPEFQWTTVETGAVQLGVPDSEYCGTGGRSGWVEFKRSTAWAVRVRPEQIGWIGRRVRLGGRVWIAVRRVADAGPRRAAVDELHMVPGSCVEDLALRGGLQNAVVRENSFVLPDPWDWAFVERLLIS